MTKDYGKHLTIEVCCASVDDVVCAAAAGVDRVELNLALEAVGLGVIDGHAGTLGA